MDESSGEVSVLARFETDAASAQRLGDRLAEALDAGTAAVAAYAATGGRWIVEIHFNEPPDRHAVCMLFAALAGEEAVDRLEFATVAPRDWVAASLAGLPPVAVGRFLVHGAHDRGRVAANRIAIEIEAALAFGTGHHGTTRACLLALDRLVKRSRPRRVLDIGTGSGVLAIAAARALCRPVTASDIDSTSVAAARHNARINRVGAWIAVIRANGVADRRMRRRAPYDLAFANILLVPLRRLARPVGAVVAPGGRVVLSGLLPAEASAALAAWRMVGFVLERRLTIDGWVTLVVMRRELRKG
jgi:ribosomal protein L11 methyltransferase